jgi:S1-C subfamily serine protease
MSQLAQRTRAVVVVGLAAAVVVAVFAAVTGGRRAAAASPPGVATAKALENAYTSIYENVSPSVVQIETSEGLGSGIVFDGKGDIVTNAHVVGSATRFQVTTSTGKQLSAKLVSSFAPDDLAVIKLTGNASLRPASFADSSKLNVGDIVMAIGNPLGFRSSVTNGIVSALGRAVPESATVTLPNTIQTSAPINPGNSGGALVDIQGKVVGIPTLGISDQQTGGAAVGIGFAIPSSVVTDIASQIVENGRVTNSRRAYLGVQVGETQGQGVYVGAAQAGGPAAKAGIKAGDFIVSVAGHQVASVEQLSTVLAGLRPGQTVPVVVASQSGVKRTVSLTLGQYPG